MAAVRKLVPVLLLALVGCGSGIKEEKVTPPTVTPKEAIQKALTPVAETGQVGSEVGGVMQDVQALKASDAALADTLQKGLNELMTMSENPEGAKKKAKELLTALSAGGG
jgi:hypothetical protein